STFRAGGPAPQPRGERRSRDEPGAERAPPRCKARGRKDRRPWHPPRQARGRSGIEGCLSATVDDFLRRELDLDARSVGPRSSWTEERSKIAFWIGSEGATESRTGGVGTPKNRAFSGRGGANLPVMGRERAVQILDSS